MQCFESCHLSQPVRSPPANVRRSLKTARYRGILRIPLGLRVGNWARERGIPAPGSPRPFFGVSFLLDPLIGAGDIERAFTVSGDSNGRPTAGFCRLPFAKRLFGLPVW